MGADVPEHVLHVKLLERTQDMLHSAMQVLESYVVYFVQALHLRQPTCLLMCGLLMVAWQSDLFMAVTSIQSKQQLTAQHITSDSYV